MKCSTCDKDKDESEFTYRKDRGKHEYSCKTCKNKEGRLYYKRKTELDLTRERELIEADPYRYTIAKILERARLDKATEFIAGEWFGFLCDLAGFEPEHIRRRMSESF